MSPTASPTLPSLVPTNYPTEMPVIPEPTPDPTLGFTDGKCCHARDNTDRMELRCNELEYINMCLSRYWHSLCQWDLDLLDSLCPYTLVKDLDGENCYCDFEQGARGAVDDRTRRGDFCLDYEFDPEACEAFECGTYVCEDTDDVEVLDDDS